MSKYAIGTKLGSRTILALSYVAGKVQYYIVVCRKCKKESVVSENTLQRYKKNKCVHCYRAESTFTKNIRTQWGK